MRRQALASSTVALGFRVAEEDHHGVADELVDGAAVLEGDLRHLGEILVEQERDLLRLQALRGRGEILDIGEEDGELLALGVDGDVLLAAENARVDLRREIVRDLRRNPDEKIVGGLELSVHILQASIELRLLLLQQRHFIGFLLHAAGRVALGRDVEQHHPHGAGVEMKMKIGGAAAVELDRGNEIGRLDQRQKPFEEEDLLDRRLAEAHRRQPIILEMPAGADQSERGIDLQIGNRPLAYRSALAAARPGSRAGLP